QHTAGGVGAGRPRVYERDIPTLRLGNHVGKGQRISHPLLAQLPGVLSGETGLVEVAARQVTTQRRRRRKGGPVHLDERPAMGGSIRGAGSGKHHSSSSDGSKSTEK